MTSLQTLSQSAQSLQQAGRPFILATLVRVVGPAFRPLGARMLVEADGRRTGDLSGGCLDEDVAARARECLEGEGDQLLVYDGERIADLARGFATGCPRRVEILLQRVDPQDETPFASLARWQRERRAGVHLTWLPPDRSGPAPRRALDWDLEGSPPSQTDEELDRELRDLADRLRADPRSTTVRLRTESESAEALAEVFLPRPRLLCLGGSVALLAALRAQADLLGWETVLVDGGGPSHGPDPEGQRTLAPEEIDEAIGLDPRTCALVLTHHNERDRRWMHALLSTEVPYVGVMGSRRRLERLFESMREDELTAEDHSRIHAPVGLDLGGRGSAEMALSVFAEMQSVLHGRLAAPLRHGLEAGETAALILAAGGSARLGTAKQLLHHGGQTLLRHTARQALRAGCRPVVVVLGSQAERMGRELDGLDVSLCVHERWQEGVGGSLARGIAHLRALSRPGRRVLVTLCDQPAVDADLLRDLLELHRREGHSRSACEYDGILGPPAVFESELYDALEQTRGDVGARELLRADDADVARLPFAAGSLDLDHPEDLRVDRSSG